MDSVSDLLSHYSGICLNILIIGPFFGGGECLANWFLFLHKITRKKRNAFIYDDFVSLCHVGCKMAILALVLHFFSCLSHGSYLLSVVIHDPPFSSSIIHNI